MIVHEKLLVPYYVRSSTENAPRNSVMENCEPVHPYLPHGLSASLQEPEEGPYADNATFLRDLEALSTLQAAHLFPDCTWLKFQ